MKTITKYQSADGIEFNTEQACTLYEQITNSMDKIVNIGDTSDQNCFIYSINCYGQRISKEYKI